MNTVGNCIPSPQQAPHAPAGATAQCNDGTSSFKADAAPAPDTGASPAGSDARRQASTTR
ncbi:hypothetical protein [Rhodococcus sp. KBW08]|uniref:hypothetical protein n=1 Tax=Rhodococcus sp. KBW08 TaxID=2144188 RepID=UPI0037C944EF